MKLKMPDNPPTPPEGYYWDDKDGDINLRVVGLFPSNNRDLQAWIAYNNNDEDGLPYYATRCHNDDTKDWPHVGTETLEQAMNWIVAAVTFDIRKEPQ
jgi:hypothetical protein